ncbi:hypothetical protein DLAC_04395 [Tieghemostelium lacteum]|uniref:Uncharacterized protein n=1 Tax=Tieghemostelium lacteum TaxID=361077 RepID=A0A151ZJM4_TIELA|nr:hypothetical protein DLAC_04395 [Tieghemostelium lacteum]|eukprot:KYQ94115.1 hypothetical protein DLAC_04395 [Tieghemostelium lacteum]
MNSNPSLPMYIVIKILKHLYSYFFKEELSIKFLKLISLVSKDFKDKIVPLIRKNITKHVYNIESLKLCLNKLVPISLDLGYDFHLNDEELINEYSKEAYDCIRGNLESLYLGYNVISKYSSKLFVPSSENLKNLSVIFGKQDIISSDDTKELPKSVDNLSCDFLGDLQSSESGEITIDLDGLLQPLENLNRISLRILKPAAVNFNFDPLKNLKYLVSLSLNARNIHQYTILLITRELEHLNSLSIFAELDYREISSMILSILSENNKLLFFKLKPKTYTCNIDSVIEGLNRNTKLLDLHIISDGPFRKCKPTLKLTNTTLQKTNIKALYRQWKVTSSIHTIYIDSNELILNSLLFKYIKIYHTNIKVMHIEGPGNISTVYEILKLNSPNLKTLVYGSDILLTETDDIAQFESHFYESLKINKYIQNLTISTSLTSPPLCQFLKDFHHPSLTDLSMNRITFWDNLESLTESLILNRNLQSIELLELYDIPETPLDQSTYLKLICSVLEQNHNIQHLRISSPGTSNLTKSDFNHFKKVLENNISHIFSIHFINNNENILNDIALEYFIETSLK